MASRKTKAGSTNSPDKKLPLNKSIPLGIQHVLAMFAGNITVPIIVAGVFGQTPEQKIFLIQMALFVAGLIVSNFLPSIAFTYFPFINALPSNLSLLAINLYLLPELINFFL